MREVKNWDDIEERQPGEFERPAPGGYIARIVSVEDNEEKEYLRIEWDFEEGEHRGSNAATFNRAGFWPTVLIRSYKEKALGFFKAFKTSVELSNRGYVFDCANTQGLENKLMGVVLGEEEYVKKAGDIGTRLYVYQARTVKAIRDGDFKIPELKRMTQGQNERCTMPASNDFSELNEDDDEILF